MAFVYQNPSRPLPPPFYPPDTFNCAVRAVTAQGAVSTLAGGGVVTAGVGAGCGAVAGFVDGTGSNAIFNYPYGLVVTASGSIIYVAGA